MNGTHSPRRTGRSIWAVVAGLLFIVITSTATDVVMHTTGVFPPPGEPMPASLWLFATAYRIVFSVLGCWITARLAPDRPMRHALILGFIGILISTAGTIATWNEGPGFGPKWYPIGLILVSLPCAWLGGKLADARKAPEVQPA
jgi:peptidoglycan/LPS O-acetylase OafA/YrhL